MPVRGSVKRPPLNRIMRFRRNTQCVINRLVYLIDHNGILYGRTGPFIGGLPVDQSFFDTSAPKQYGTAIGKVSVHAIEFFILYNFWLVDLIFYLFPRAALHDGIPAKLAGQNDQRSVQMTAFIEIFDQLRYRPIDKLLHLYRTGMAVLMGVPAKKRFVFGRDTYKPAPVHSQPFGQ